ncbi:hypothetical protein FBEOM_10741 [Fusarium beomiforme]|uniref:Uncharacterized protein n=1 Tax=Fusarium beomiforme TaxID=44412 RepID=A0A9P5AAS3_9HYPO|nr:hypothetical protein FBEOM_10741 [Fusarium beomiforme]
METYRSAEAEYALRALSFARDLHKSTQRLHNNLRCHKLLPLEDNDLEVVNHINTVYARMRELQQAQQDTTVLERDIEKLGDKRSDLKRRMRQEERENPMTVDKIRTRIQPDIDHFMEASQRAMEMLLVRYPIAPERQQKYPSDRLSRFPPSPDINGGEGSDQDFDGPMFGHDSLLLTPGDTPRSKRTTPEGPEAPPSPKRHCVPSMTVKELSRAFPDQKVTETPARCGNWYVFRCEEHGMFFNGLTRPAQAAARHATRHGLPPKNVSAIDAFGIKVIDCNTAAEKTHNERVQKRQEESHDRARSEIAPTDPRGHGRPEHNDNVIAELLGDINPRHPRHQPRPRAAAKRPAVVQSREYDGTLRPREVVAGGIYWVRWDTDDLYYPAFVLPCLRSTDSAANIVRPSIVVF